MNRKVTYLLIALVLPGLLFIFLKFFGKNQFDIPVFFEKGNANAPTECVTVAGKQYLLPDSVLTTVKWGKDVALVINGTTREEQSELKRLIKEPKLGSLQIISLDNIEANRLQRWKDCVFFLKAPWKAILIDSQKRIRGYYALDSREEIDRLEVELEILLKK